MYFSSNEFLWSSSYFILQRRHSNVHERDLGVNDQLFDIFFITHMVVKKNVDFIGTFSLIPLNSMVESPWISFFSPIILKIFSLLEQLNEVLLQIYLIKVLMKAASCGSNSEFWKNVKKNYFRIEKVVYLTGTFAVILSNVINSCVKNVIGKHC